MFFLRAGALLAGLAVIAGAFGAHLLEDALTLERLETFETAAKYQMYHALALVGIGLTQRPEAFKTSGYLFIAGTVVFSGSLYLLVLTDTAWLGAITPIGGVLFITGWGFLAATRIRKESRYQTTSSSSKESEMLG